MVEASQRVPAQAQTRRYQMLINGERVDSASGEVFESMNPFTGDAWALVPRAGKEDADRAVQAADAALRGPWGRMNGTQRAKLLRRLAEVIASHGKDLARTEVTDNGKLLSEMEGQLAYLPDFYCYFAGLADKLQGDAIPTEKPDMFTFTRREPLGVCVAITAWNSPLLLAAYKLAPGLAAGNTFVLKPSEYASVSTLEFASLFEEAGFPPGVVNVVTGFGTEIGEALVSHPKVAMVSFTGSEATGRRIYENAARGLKRVGLELGGKSPNIVFDDADMDSAAHGAISGIFAAAGQVCVAGSRLLVQEGIYDAFVDRIVSIARSARLGDPMHASTHVGPMANAPQYGKVLEYLDIAKAEGARCLVGGAAAQRPECGKGIFIEPTIFDGVSNDMRIAREEVFGPVLSVMRFRDMDEAVRIANDTNYGLAAGVWTRDIQRALVMSQRIEAGSVWVNTYRAMSYSTPFGGYKRSGVGRANGIEGIDAYLQTKSVWISTADQYPNPFQ
jgi:acyl-CoA reductase-like NAD-dependent aldehyde dehydrogenase